MGFTSAFGPKRTSITVRSMSAIHPIAAKKLTIAMFDPTRRNVRIFGR
jgi:hypothetical protein